MLDKLLIQKARQTNLPQYLLNRGEKLKQNGRRYRHTEHESLVFTDNAYFWNARGEHGNAVDFLMSFYGMDFKAAVTELAGKEIAGQQKKESAQPLTEQIFTFAGLSLIRDTRRAIAYLHKTRGIDYSIIQKLIKEKHIYQEKETNNIVFPMYDENNKCVGAELQGTLSRRRYKGVASRSKYGYGFNVRYPGSGGSFDYALFFESAVDLLSFVDLKINFQHRSLESCILVSMSGLKENIVNHTLTAYRGNFKPIQPVLCVDSDKAGQDFVTRLKSQIRGVRTLQTICKDWNDQLLNTPSTKERQEHENDKANGGRAGCQQDRDPQ